MDQSSTPGGKYFFLYSLKSDSEFSQRLQVEVYLSEKKGRANLTLPFRIKPIMCFVTS